MTRMSHLDHMHFAYTNAAAAYAAGNRPVAALVVRDGTVLGAGLNTTAADRDPTAHAEVAAIRNACRALDTLDLSGSTLYTTLEPCPLCLWTLLESKCARLVMGARHAALGRADIGELWLAIVGSRI